MKIIQSKKIKFFKLQLTTAIFLLITAIISGIFIFSPISLEQVALALNPSDYNKPIDGQLTANDWNQLDDDFVAKSGDTMSGGLILSADPTDSMHAATKQYVDRRGGDIFTNWGRSDCPAGVNELYNGFVFGKRWDEPKGSGEILCIESGMAGPPNTSAIRDKLWPVGTGVTAYTPPAITTNSEIPCAVCYNPGGTCYRAVGTNICNNAEGFNVAYTGYIMGGVTGLDNPFNENNNGRECVNANFDGSTPNLTFDSVYAGTVIVGNADLPVYTTDSYIHCAVCCN